MTKIHSLVTTLSNISSKVRISGSPNHKTHTFGHNKPLFEDLVWPLPYDVDACAGAYHGGDNGQKKHCTRSEHRCVECGGAIGPCCDPQAGNNTPHTRNLNKPLHLHLALSLRSPPPVPCTTVNPDRLIGRATTWCRR
jgi:hypothetical protein